MEVKRAIFFDSYLDTLGGGERYFLSLASYLIGKGWSVSVVWDNQEIKKKLTQRFGFNLEKLEIISPPGIIARVTDRYDLAFYVSDGSIPWLWAKNNILHFQVPFRRVGGGKWINQLKLKNITSVVCNSMFTKNFIDSEFGVNAAVIYPPIDVEKFKPSKKENIILTVGRFSQLLQAKGQDVLVEAFKKMCDRGFRGWKLILAGGTDVGGREFFNNLKRLAVGYPIDFFENPSLSNLLALYGRAKFFWYAAGYGIDEEEQPEKVEHFGMTVVEAMAAGCFPLVVCRGGIREIVESGENGFCWETQNELIESTRRLAKNDRKLSEYSEKVIKSSQRFSLKKFCEKFDEIIG